MEENYINQFVLSFHLVTLCYVRFRVRLNSTILDKKNNDYDDNNNESHPPPPLFVLNSLYIGIHFFSGDDHKLCWKDLRSEVIRKLDVRLKNDQTAFKQICQTFGINRSLFPYQTIAFDEILRMFPNTPVKLVKEVFEALQLYDLIDLLEEGKPQATRSLRPALRLQEIEKLRNPDDRPISYHSSVAVLIIDFEENFDTKGIEKFFKGLNTKSEVTVMRCRNILEAALGLQVLVAMREAIKIETNKLGPKVSEVIQSWISNQGW